MLTDIVLFQRLFMRICIRQSKGLRGMNVPQRFCHYFAKGDNFCRHYLPPLYFKKGGDS